jgi:hypothetical protein
MRFTLSDVAEDKKKFLITKDKKKILILSILCIFIILASGVTAYIFLSTEKKEIYKPVPAAEQVAQATQQTTASPVSEITDTKPSERSLTEKDPFKAEFLEKFIESQKEKFPDESFAINSPSAELSPIIIQGDLPNIESPFSEQLQKPAPQIKILGIYKIGEKTVALTDRGELREGMFVEAHRVVSITREKLELEGVDTPYFITGVRE